MVLIDQDGAGPGGSDQMSMLALLQAPQVEVLGITIVTGVTHGATRRLCTPCACWS
jgi:inosine-uridine nucleoside N-ribohydrolase